MLLTCRRDSLPPSASPAPQHHQRAAAELSSVSALQSDTSSGPFGFVGICSGFSEQKSQKLSQKPPDQKVALRSTNRKS